MTTSSDMAAKAARQRHFCQQRSANFRTIIAHGVEMPSPLPFQDLFMLHYTKIRSFYQRCRNRGILAVSITNDQLMVFFIGASQWGVTTAIVGRHESCDLRPARDPLLSLRQLAVIIHPLTIEEIRYRLIDLNTPAGYQDEYGREMRSLEVEGTVFIQCRRSALFFFPTADEIPWPEDAAQAWECIPERVYLQEVPVDLAPWQERQLQRKMGHSCEAGSPREKTSTQVNIQKAALPADRLFLLGEGEEAKEVFQIRSRRGSCSAITVGHSALERGVLLGRYARCDNDNLQELNSAAISRVHLLFTLVAGDLWAIDTASSNGTFVDQLEVRSTKMEYGKRLVLAEGAASVEVVPAQ